MPALNQRTPHEDGLRFQALATTGAVTYAVLVAWGFLSAGAQPVAQMLHPLRCFFQVGLHDLEGVLDIQMGVPGTLRVDDHHRAVAALTETTGAVDAHLGLQPASFHLPFQASTDVAGRAIDGAIRAVRADEKVEFVGAPGPGARRCFPFGGRLRRHILERGGCP